MYTFNTINITFILFGAILIAGLISGELSKRTIILPTISGYILSGLLLGPSGLDLLSSKLIKTANIFVDICFGLILFELGKNFNLKLIKSDPWLLIGGICSSLTSFAIVFVSLLTFDYSLAKSLTISTIFITSSPAIIFMVARELRSDNPVIRRSKSLVAINNVVGLLVFITILPYLHYKFRTDEISIWFQPLYFFLGSVTIGFICYLLTLFLALILSKDESKQFIMSIAVIMLNIGFCYAFNLSLLISLLFYGIFIKNLNFKHTILNPDFGYLEDLFFLMLFVITGANLNWAGIDRYLTPACTLLLVRFISQSIPIYIFSLKSGFTKKQAWLVSASLAPIAATALGITYTAVQIYPEFSNEFLQIILISLLIMQFFGPIITRWAFKSADLLPTHK